MVFWIVAIAMALGVAAVLAGAMLRGGAGGAEASDLDIYRDQLAEVERDRARGLIDAAEAERSRVEISRRLLDADRKAQARGAAAEAPTRATRQVAVLTALAVLLAGVGMYASLGAPGYMDLPIKARIAMAEETRKNRPDQALAEVEAAAERPSAQVDPQHAELIEKLRGILRDRPDDLQGHILLAQNEAQVGNFAAAGQAQARVIAIKGDAASAEDFADYALLLLYAAGGYVSPEAEGAVNETLRRAPDNGIALYLSGLLYAQTDRPDIAFRIWRPLLERSTPDAPWFAPIRDGIAQIARLAGVRYTPPSIAPLPGPSQADVDAAADMTPEEQQAMVRGMVEGLSSRLAESGGTSDEWARLIGALGVLGERDRAREIYREAREAFGESPADLARIDDAANRAGVTE